MEVEIILLASFLFAVNHLNDAFKLKKSKEEIFLSLSSGIAVAYVFLFLMPESLIVSNTQMIYVFGYALTGFAIFHLAEKYIYQHAEKERIFRELKNQHAITSFVYHFITGILLVHFIGIDLRSGLFYAFPVALTSIATSISLSEIHGSIRSSKLLSLVLSAAPLFGAALMYFLKLNPQILAGILGAFSGIYLYVNAKEVMPTGIKGRPLYFIIGIILMILLMILRGAI